MHIVIQNYDIEVYAEVDHDHVLAGISVYQVSLVRVQIITGTCH